MAKVSLQGFKDPKRRPRYILWTLAAVFGIIALTIVALGATSSYWFCANGCHKVQDDTITAYNNSSHSQVSCMACHMPANADPVTFMLHKVTALGELYLTATGSYEIPLNGESHLAMDGEHMPSTQCTQCHSDNRVPTPTEGVLIDHEVHAEGDIHCSVCHNRIAHNEEGITFVNVDPNTNQLNTGHEDFMEMTACFRCHSQEPDAIAPGACEACHPVGFELKPGNHNEPGFYEEGGESAGHAELAEIASSEPRHQVRSRKSSHEAEEAVHEARWRGRRPACSAQPEEINYCSTCHSTQFCTDCHGLPMPHPAGFQDDHGDAGHESPGRVCELPCQGRCGYIRHRVLRLLPPS